MRKFSLQFILLAACAASGFAQQRTNSQPGLIVTFSGGNATHSTVSPQIALYVPANGAVSPFIPNGPFTAKWEGNINADLRGEFFFRAEGSGAFELNINGKKVLQLANAKEAFSEAAQLNKGPNVLQAVFTSASQGDSWVRLGWTEKGTNTSPIPHEILNHSVSPNLARDEQAAFGRELFLEHRCVKCHTMKFPSPVPELSMDAPTFEGMGNRRQTGWLAGWILHPKAHRSETRMPELLHGETAETDARAIAGYLGGLNNEATSAMQPLKPFKKEQAPADSQGETKPLFDKLLCAGCHAPPDFAGTPTNKVALRHVAEKFSGSQLADYLLMPERHYAWTRMPNFRLTEGEAKTISEQLLAIAPKAQPTAPDPGLAGKGKELLQARGCLNCHSLTLENKFTAKPLERLDWTRGCMAERPEANAPHFGFSPEERAALRAFGKTDFQSLNRHAPAEFAERQTRLLNCTACHGQQEGFPPLPILGGKLRPEWVSAFVGGEIPYKPRAEAHPRGETWLEARMPAFRSRANFLAEGLAAQHGFPPHTAPNPNPDSDLAKIGQKLVGKDGGFSCVSCHAVGALAATDVFESEGINLIHSADRLLPDYYRRWVRNPLSIDPQTKMPMYFEEGHSPLTEILDGDAEKQITAIWHYLLLGEKMPPPSSGETQ